VIVLHLVLKKKRNDKQSSGSTVVSYSIVVPASSAAAVSAAASNTGSLTQAISQQLAANNASINLTVSSGSSSQTTVTTGSSSGVLQVCELTYSSDTTCSTTPTKNCYDTNGLTCDGMELVKQGRWGLACDAGFSNYSTCCVSGVTDSFMATCGAPTATQTTYTLCTSFYSDNSCSSKVSSSCLDVSASCSDMLALRLNDYQAICANITNYNQCCNSISLFGIDSVEVTCSAKSSSSNSTTTTTSASNTFNTMVALTIPTILGFFTYFRLW